MRVKAVALVLCLAMLVLMLAACGDKDTKAEEAASEETVETVQEETEQETEQEPELEIEGESEVVWVGDDAADTAEAQG